MSNVKLRFSKGEGPLSDRLTVFVFFLSGALLSFFGSISMRELLPPRLLMSGILGAVLLFSASFLGSYLLPCCALAAGVFAEETASAWTEKLSGGMHDLRILICSAVLVPVFFLCCVHGMYVSGTIHSAVSGASPSARDLCQQEYFAVVFFAVFGYAVIFFFT